MLSILLCPPSTPTLAPEMLSAPSPCPRPSQRRQKFPCPGLGTPRADHTEAAHVRPPGPRFHRGPSGKVLPFLCAWPDSRSAPPASNVTSAFPKPGRHGSEATQSSQQTCA